MISKKKKIIVISVMLLLLVITGYLNIRLNSGAIETGGSNLSTASFFVTYREDRQETRNDEILYYDAIIASTASTTEAIKLAEEKKAELIAQMDSELVIEGLIKAKGFEDCIISTSSDNINCIVKSANLTSNEVAQIVSIILEQTGKSLENIKITPIE